MRAQSEKEPVQGVRRGEHLPARSAKEPVQGVRRGGHLPARSEKEPVQGVRRVEHLPARSDKEHVQGVQTIVSSSIRLSRPRYPPRVLAVNIIAIIISFLSCISPSGHHSCPLLALFLPGVASEDSASPGGEETAEAAAQHAGDGLVRRQEGLLALLVRARVRSGSVDAKRALDLDDMLEHSAQRCQLTAGVEAPPKEGGAQAEINALVVL